MTDRSVWDLGVYLEAYASMTTHVTKCLSSCFAALRLIRAIRRSVTRSVAGCLIDPVTMCGNATVDGSPSYMFDKLQSVLNAAAPLIFSTRRFESNSSRVVYRAPATGTLSLEIVHRQPAMNNKLAPKPTPKPNHNSTLSLT